MQKKAAGQSYEDTELKKVTLRNSGRRKKLKTFEVVGGECDEKIN
jgi:hypothetical protein